MIRKTFPLALMLLAAIALSAQETKKESVKLTGILIDNMCAGSETTEAEAKHHKTSCALMPGCAKSGFSVVAAEKSYRLDEAGNKQALAILKDTKTKAGVSVQVEGTIEGDTLHVDQISEVH